MGWLLTQKIYHMPGLFRHRDQSLRLPERTHSLNFILAADDKRGAVVHSFGRFVENPLTAIRGSATCLLGDERERIGLVEQTQFAFGSFLRRRIEEHATTH